MEKIKFEDGQLIKAAYITIDDIEYEVIPAVYEGSTPLSSYNLNRMQKEIIDDGIIVSPIEPTTDRRKVWFKNKKNILPTDFNMWVSGQYNSGTGVAENSTVRVRLNSLLKIQSGETYYFNTFSDFEFIIRTYNKDGVFSRNMGGIQNGSTVITNENEGYLGVTLYKPNGTTTYPLYEDYRTLFGNKTIRPMICLNCETDKSFQKYIEPVIYIKNNNGDYEEFMKKEEQTKTITNSNGTAILYSDGTMICTKRINLTGVDITIAHGALFATSQINLGDFACPFIDVPTMNMSLYNSWSGFIGYNENFSKISAGTIQIVRVASATNAYYNIAITAIGHWK